MTVDRVDSVQVTGANVMAGRHDDGSIEVRIWAASPVNPETASDEMELLN